MDNRFYINNVGISVTNINNSVQIIQKYIESGSNTNYICVTNSRAAYIAIHENRYCEILNNSLLTLPDGKPIEWIGHLMGYKDVCQITGNDIFEAMCKLSKNNKYTHYFIGSTISVLNKMIINLKIKYPYLDIVGVVSPPIQSAKELVTNELIDDINKIKPTFIWIGLGAPKQEEFIDIIKSKINSSILVGIGLVFEYQAETIKRAPKQFRQIGFEWLYIWFQQPKKIIRGYKYYPYFIQLLIVLIIKKYIKPIVDVIK